MRVCVYGLCVFALVAVPPEQYGGRTFTLAQKSIMLSRTQGCVHCAFDVDEWHMLVASVLCAEEIVRIVFYRSGIFKSLQLQYFALKFVCVLSRLLFHSRAIAETGLVQSSLTTRSHCVVDVCALLLYSPVSQLVLLF